MGLLITAKSFDCGASPDGRRYVGVNSPSKTSTFQTIFVGVIFLFCTEQLCRLILARYQVGARKEEKTEYLALNIF